MGVSVGNRAVAEAGEILRVEVGSGAYGTNIEGRYEFLSTGHIVLPIQEPLRSWLVDLRLGKHSMAEALVEASAWENGIRVMLNRTDLRERADYERLDRLVCDLYFEAWVAP